MPSYWSEGVVYCTCGHLLKEIAANRGVIQKTLDLLSIPEYVSKKGRLHCHRYGKTPEKKEYLLVHNLKKRCIKRKITWIHDRFLRDSDFVNPCSNMIEMKTCVSNGTILQNKISPIECQNQNIFRYKQNWWIFLNKSGNTGPLRNRSDFNEALSALNRLHRES